MPEQYDPETYPHWNEIVAACYGEQHPLRLIGNMTSLNSYNNEGLILAARDGFLPPHLYVEPDAGLAVSTSCFSS